MKRREQQEETRLERWLAEVAERLEASGTSAMLVYDDRHGGDHLALVARAGDAQSGQSRPPGHWELLADRSARHVVLRVLADGADAASRIDRALAGAHRDVRRRDNARRKFLHRIERMASHLAETFHKRRALFPQASIRDTPGARPLVGIERRWSGRAAEAATEPAADDSAKKRDARRYGTVWGVVVATMRGPRAALFDPLVGGFRFGKATLTAAALGAAAAAAAGVVAGVQQPGQQRHGRLADHLADGVDLSDAGDVVVDVAGGSCWPDCDVIDLPDCDFCDVPDCSF